MRRQNASSRTVAHVEADVGNIVFATGGYDHSVKFWHPHDGVCYRTAQHPESVGIPIGAHLTLFRFSYSAAGEQVGGYS